MGKLYKMNKIERNAHIESMRANCRSRALLMYKFFEHAEKNGLNMEKFGREVIWECGCIRAENNFPETNSVKDFAAVYQTQDWIDIFDTEIVECTDDSLVVHSYYCPLLEMWETLTDDKERIAKICDIAMDGDRALAHKYPNFEFDVPTTIAAGAKHCTVTVKRKGK